MRDIAVEPHDFKDLVAKYPDGLGQYVHIRFLKKAVLRDVPLQERVRFESFSCFFMVRPFPC